ncbi:hypothetical protein C8F04DRAFT_1144860 [Mycena alexandri]|uniref:Uncharacterized protein n=1 Tax=Mycena alexandri TaxID=1745969 RepID=A0AAD6WPF8_9AGAR|nr:hypothetical protein C8F04DRAFT_1144860 [Mycena alexandri]
MRLSSKGDTIPYVQQMCELDRRSLGCPFSIEISKAYSSTRGFMFSSAQCTRLEYLKVSLWVSSLLVIEEGPTPFLRHLDLAFDYAQMSPEPVVFLDAPLLRSAALNENALHAVVLPWAQLTELTLHYLFPQECAAVLQLTSNLVYCKLIIAGNDGVQPRPDVTLLRLESLTLEPHRHTTKTSGYLETFVVPTLRHLQVEEQILGSDPVNSLIIFVSKSGCTLEGIYVSGKRQLSKDIYRRAFPSIELSFDEFYFGEGADRL